MKHRHPFTGHGFKIVERSNVLQQDSMGYPLRLCICQCTKCRKTEQQWLDTSEEALQELDDGRSVLLEWTKV